MQTEALPNEAESVLFNEDDRAFMSDNLHTERKRVMNCLLGLMAFYLISNLIQIMLMPTDMHVEAAGWIAISFFVIGQLALALISQRFAMGATIASIVLFALLIILLVIGDGPETLVKGIWMKGVMVYLLIKAYRSSKEIIDIKKEMSLFGQG